MRRELERYSAGNLQVGEEKSTLNKSKPHKRIGVKTKFFAGATIIASAAIGAVYTQKDQYTDDLANWSRSIIGENNTVRLERIYFDLEDQKNKLIYKITGDKKSPFSQAIETPAISVESSNLDETAPNMEPMVEITPVFVEPPEPPPLIFPEIQYLGVPLNEGEGIWRTDGLPQTTPEDPLMVKTVVRPDSSRPYSYVSVLLLDKRRIKLNMAGGTKSPGERSGISGPGRIPEIDKQNLLVAFNGGFQGEHAPWGMYANGKLYKTLQKGYASVAVMADGTIKMGIWGEGELTVRTEDMVAVRQNAALLVKGCQVSSRTLENNETWGYIVYGSQENVTRRSAIGLTQNGDLLVAAGDNVKPDTLARALWAAGACTAMQLDLNTPQVNTSLYFKLEGGLLKGRHFGGFNDPGRFLGTQEYDFMYVTLDESRFLP